MTISLQQLIALDTNYLGKHNANYAALEAAINTLQTQIGQSFGQLLTGVHSFEAMFGAENALINEASYVPTGSGSNLTVAAGYFWHHATSTVRRKLTSTVLSFSGDAAQTYFLAIDPTGEPLKSSASSPDDVYSVVWTGTAFGAITRLVPVAWGHTTFDAGKTNTALGGLIYQSFDPLMEALAGAVVRAISKTITSSDVTLATSEAMEHIAVIVSGTKTADRSLIVPNLEKPYIIVNNGGGAFLLTVKTAAGAGVVIANGGRSLVYCDGTDVHGISSSLAASLFRELLDVPSSYTGHALKQLGVNATETGLEFFTPVFPYDVASMFHGKPGAGVIILHHVFNRTVTFPADLSGSNYVSRVAATAQYDIDIQKNNMSVGTIRFPAGASTATFILTSATTFNAGDVMKQIAPGTSDLTLEDLAGTLAGTR